MNQSTLQEEMTVESKQQHLNISIFGLGKVGLTLAACLASAGHRVVGVDVSSCLIDSINDRTVRSDEPGVRDRILSSLGHLEATMSAEEAVQKTCLSYIIVPTPSNTFGGFSLRFVLEACRSIGKAIKNKKGNHVVSLVSTVLPGSSDQMIIPVLEEFSGRKIGSGLGYCYNPSFIALGEIVKGIECPDYVLIGESDSTSGDLVLAVQQSMISAHTPIARMRPIEAEITKLASNTHETMRVSFANMLMAACSEIPNANVDRITEALAHRMGKRFFKGAIPFGGPCWPRDNKALSIFLDSIGVPSRMPRNVDLFNDEHGAYILRKILEVSKPDSKIGILGLAYKPGTSLIERSYGVDLIRWLIAERRQIVVWDPMAIPEVNKVFNTQIMYAESGTQCLEESSILVIINPLKECDDINWSKAKDKIVIDCWRCLTLSQRKQIGNYIALGHGNDLISTSWETPHLRKRLELLTN
jgi:UDPglucose 6-dehydrogenase